MSTFTPGWRHQPGVKVLGPRSDSCMWDFAPGWRHQPGIKVSLLPGAISAESNLKNGAGSISQFSTSAGNCPQGDSAPFHS
jgi:hypothetical protein